MKAQISLLVLAFSLVTLSCCKKCDPVPATETKVILPSKVLFYYGYPALVNGSNGNINAAANIFRQFDIIILGDGIQATSPVHPDQANTKQIIDILIRHGKKVYGYIPLGNRADDRKLSKAQIEEEVAKWQKLGVTGIFGDEFDFNVNRERQNYLIDFAHLKGLSVIANGTDIDNVLGGKDCKLSGGDYYFLESYGIILGNYEELSKTISRGKKAFDYKKQLGVGVIAGGRDNLEKLSAGTPASNKYLHTYFATLLFNFDGFSYSDTHYSASGPNGSNVFNYSNILPFYGNKILTDKVAVQESNVRYVTETDTHKITLTEQSGSIEKK